VLIVDADLDHLDASRYRVVLSGNAEQADVVIAAYIDDNGERLRKKYLEFTASLAGREISGKKLTDLMVLKNGASFWWMTLLAEQNLWKSPAIIDALKVFALEEIISERKPESVLYAGPDSALFEVLSELCLSRDIPIRWQKTAAGSRVQKVKSSRLYHVLHALYFLFRQAILRLQSGPAILDLSKGGRRNVVLCNYLDQIDVPYCLEHGLRSPYWGRMDEILEEKGFRVSWLHLPVPSSSFSSRGEMKDFLDTINKRSPEKEQHTLIHSYLTTGIFFRVLCKYLKLALMVSRTGNVKAMFVPDDHQHSLFPLFVQDWYASFYGSCAMEGLLFLALFDRAVSRAETPHCCLYLLENQAWERSLLFAWRSHQSGRILGVQHSMVRFWDLRYYMCEHPATSGIPAPDLTLVNGGQAMEMMRGAGFPDEKIEAVEALRYENLKEAREKRTRTVREECSILLLGDYVEETMDKMVEMIACLPDGLLARFRLVITPHPNHPIDAVRYKRLSYSVVYSELDKILHEHTACIASNLTSASVDAVVTGAPVIIISEPEEMNFSPLRDFDGAVFADSPDKLEDAILSVLDDTQAPDAVGHEFFYLDSELPRWNAILH